MSIRKLYGSVPISKLSAGQLARVMTAIDVLETMAKEGLITFRTGVGRPHKERIETKPARLQPQRARIVETIRGDRWWSAREVADTIGIKLNSVSAQLAVLASDLTIESDSREAPREHGNFGRATIRVFRKSMSS